MTLHTSVIRPVRQIYPSMSEIQATYGRTAIIEIGQQVFCALYGGKEGTVVSIAGEQAPASCRSMGGFAVTGGAAKFDIVWQDGSQSLSVDEALLRCSVQWDIRSEVRSAAEVASAVEAAKSFKARAQAKAQRDLEEREALKAKLMNDYPGLQLAGEGSRGGVFAAKNLRTLLKRQFPGAKFSVRASYSSIDVSWIDGPSKVQVGNVADLFRNSSFDSMQDMTLHEPSAFNDLFGGAAYVNCSRDYSPELTSAAIDVVFEAFKENLEGFEKPSVHELWAKHMSIPSLDITVSEAVSRLRAAWDGTGKQYVKSPHYNRMDFFIWRADGSAKCPPLSA